MSEKDLPPSKFDLNPSQQPVSCDSDNGSLQMSIFQGLSEIRDKSIAPLVSNVLHIYSIIPKLVNRQKATDGIVTRYFPIEFGNAEKSMLEVEVREALIKVTQKDGSQKVIHSFPGVREERIEEALIYMASRGGPDVKIDTNTATVGIHFTIHKVKTVIEEQIGKKYDWGEVKEAIELLHLSGLSIKPAKGSFLGNEFNISSSRFKVLVWARKGSGDDLGSTKCYVEFHPLLAIDIINKRFNLYSIGYKKTLDLPLAHVLYSRLCVYYRNASVEKGYHFSAKTFMESSYLGFNEETPRKSWSHLRSAIKNLKDNNIIGRSEEELIYCPYSPRKKVANIIITLYATSEFQKKTMVVNSINKKIIKAAL